MVKQYFRLGRPINALAGCISVFLSGYVVGPVSWWPVILAAVTVLLITVSTNAWNDYRDIEIDKVNKPDRPLPAGKISPRGALIFFSGGTALSLIVAASINNTAFLIALGSNCLLCLYSWRLKCSILWGNAAVAGIVALCFVFGGVAAGNIQPTLMLAATVFFAIAGREVLKTMADHRGDSEHNCRTIAVGWGNRVARTFMIVFLGISSMLMLVTYFIEQYSPVYLYVIVLGIYPLFTYISINAKASAAGETLELNSTLMKYGFFAWFLAVALGAGLAS